MRFVIAVVLSFGVVGSALAEEASPSVPERTPFVNRPTPPAQPKLDFSRPVTLTGLELQALIKAEIAAARAQDAAQAAAEASVKVRDAMTVPDDKPSDQR